MKRAFARVGEYTLLTLLTAFAVGVMWWASSKSDESAAAGESAAVTAVPVSAQPRTLVKAAPVRAAMRDVVIRYSGKIQPWETYSLGFEVGGRVATLGENAGGRPLDEGDRVAAGQVLARLDDRVLRAQLAEAVANFELAASEMQRTRGARSVLSESEYDNAVAARSQALATQQVAEKRLEDTLLTSPVAGTISRRWIEAGESVGANEAVFEVVENDRLRLVLNVPEARVRELELRRRAVQQARSEGSPTSQEDAVFRAHVRLEGADLYGRPWPPIDAEVYRIAETADMVTGLFEVEIEVDNRGGLLRPGMVATADLVTDRLYAYELPEAAVLFRQGQTYTFAVEEQPVDLEVMFWDVGDTPVQRARRLDLTRWVDQGETVLVPAEGVDLPSVVTRGQERLRDGQLVRVVDGGAEETTQASVGEGSSAL